MARIGVLALQGSVAEHMHKLQELHNVEAVAVKTTGDMRTVDGIILPGGESTAIGKLLNEFGLHALLKRRIEDGFPAWGTCAGLILLAKEIDGESPHLAAMDIRVRRNAYGTQVDSFTTESVIPAVSRGPIDLVFIRAPWIEEAKSGVEVLCALDGHIVAARQGNMLATSFHPELTRDPRFHNYFLQCLSADK
jgi:pyridoxal 5'-phosphate synthase pdxT subunit